MLGRTDHTKFYVLFHFIFFFFLLHPIYQVKQYHSMINPCNCPAVIQI